MGAHPADSIDQLYAEALRLGDAARGYFDGPGVAARAALPAVARATMAVESLAITARLIAVVSWSLQHKAGGTPMRARLPERRLDVRFVAGTVASTLPAIAHSIAVASRDLFTRALAVDGRHAAGEGHDA